MENHVRLFHSKVFIENVLGNGFCVIRAFQEGLGICYNENHKLCDVKAALRSEILRNFDGYSAFFSDKVNVLMLIDFWLIRCNIKTLILWKYFLLPWEIVTPVTQ